MPALPAEPHLATHPRLSAVGNLPQDQNWQAWAVAGKVDYRLLQRQAAAAARTECVATTSKHAWNAIMDANEGARQSCFWLHGPTLPTNLTLGIGVSGFVCRNCTSHQR